MAKTDIIKVEIPLMRPAPVDPNEITMDQVIQHFYGAMQGRREDWENVYCKHPDMIEDIKKRIAANQAESEASAAAFREIAIMGTVKVRGCFSCGQKFEYRSKDPRPICPCCGTNNEEFSASE